MTWATELQRIRTYLRDPKGNIWSESLLRNLWNEVQSDLQNKTNMLEDMDSVSVPPRYQVSYMHDWEVEFIGAGETAYRCLRNQGNYFSFVCRFEAQIAAGIGTDATDIGPTTVTHPWEAWVQTDVGHEIPFPLPNNFSSMKWISHDRDPISFTSRGQVQNTGGSWATQSGSPASYYHVDDIENQIVLWPRPSTADWRDGMEDAGMVTHIEDDTNAVDLGTMVRRTGSFMSQDTGIAVDVIELADNILIAHDIDPTEVTSLGSEIDWPDFMTRYVRFGVLQRAYRANTDGQNTALATFWQDRYGLGVEAIKQFRKKKTVRNRRLGTSTVRRRDRRPRLPDTFPAI